jgi:hypothetical protein
MLTGKLKYSSINLNKSVQTEDGSEFIVFRQISRYPKLASKHSCVFIVRFKFKHLSHKANRIASKIPMLLIAGHPGFVSKCYAVNHKNGYWQGMYEWKSLQDLEAYKESFVFRVMNRRAVSNSVQFKTMINQNLTQYLDNNIKYTENMAWTNFPIMII